MSSSVTTADNSEVKGAKELLQQMSATQKVENYLDFFAIKVAPDVIPMNWCKFIDIAQLGSKWLCVTATQLLLKECFPIVG